MDHHYYMPFREFVERYLAGKADIIPYYLIFSSAPNNYRNSELLKIFTKPEYASLLDAPTERKWGWSGKFDVEPHDTFWYVALLDGQEILICPGTNERVPDYICEDLVLSGWFKELKRVYQSVYRRNGISIR